MIEAIWGYAAWNAAEGELDEDDEDDEDKKDRD